MSDQRDYETTDVEGAARWVRMHELPPEPEEYPPPRHELEELERATRRARERDEK